MATTHTDCWSEEGITVGLIDAIMSIARVLRPRLEVTGNNRLPQAVMQALDDMHSDNDMCLIQTIYFTKID